MYIYHYYTCTSSTVASQCFTPAAPPSCAARCGAGWSLTAHCNLMVVYRHSVEHMRVLYRRLYPRLRIYLFDARRLYSSPITVFGPLLAVIYVGRHYLAFRDTGRVETILDHFDQLVRESTVSDREFPAFLDENAPSALSD